MLKKLSLNEFILGLYLFIIYTINHFLNYFNTDNEDNTLQMAGITLLIAVIAFTVAPVIINAVARIKTTASDDSPKAALRVFICCSLVSFAVFMLWYAAYVPGGFMEDSIVQTEQALTGHYNDWHPVWHTLVIFTLPLKLGLGIESIVILQILYASLALGFAMSAIDRYAGRKVSVISLVYILMNPFVGCLIVCPMKDIAFAVSGTILMTMTLVIYQTKGAWMEKRSHILLYGIFLGSTTLFRHNGILFTVPLSLALFFQLNRKAWLKQLAVFAIFFLFIKVGVYHMLDVSKPGNRHMEMMGVPLSIIGNAVKEAPDKLDDEIKAFAYSMGPREVWEEKFSYDEGFNSVKYAIDDYEPIEAASIPDILHMSLRCFRYAPVDSCRAFFSLTDQVYKIDDNIDSDFDHPYIPSNGLEIKPHVNATARHFLKAYKSFINHTALKYIKYIGISILAMLVFILGRSDLKSKADWEKILLALPIFIYDFGTMLFLSGSDGRFFLISIMVCPLVIGLMLMEKDDKTMD